MVHNVKPAITMIKSNDVV